jgi:hypothetical protein
VANGINEEENVMNAHRNIRPRLPFLVMSLFVFTLSGCMGKTIERGPTLVTEYQRERVCVIVVGEFQSEKLSAEHREELYREIVKVLKEQNAFVQVLHKVPLDGKDELILLLNGEIVEYEEWRNFVQRQMGFGVGASGLTATFNLSTPEDQRIVAFSLKRTSVSMEDPTRDIGEDIAVTVSKWKRGEPLIEESPEEEHPSETPFNDPTWEQHISGETDE